MGHEQNSAKTFDSYLILIDKTFAAKLLNEANKMPEAEIYIEPFSLDMSACLLLKTIFVCTTSEQATFVSGQLLRYALFLFMINWALNSLCLQSQIVLYLNAWLH